MPTGGINGSPYGPGLFVKENKTPSSIFDNLFKSKSKSNSAPKAEALASDKASISTSTSSSASTIVGEIS